jgi:Protein of unknown function (DUF3570)
VSSRFISVVAVVAALSTPAVDAWAAGANDADVRALIRDIFDSEVANESYQGALDNLSVAKVVCEGDACSDEVEAELLVAVGTVHALLDNDEDAKEAFVEALKKDGGAKLMSKHKGDGVQAIWDGAKGKLKSADSEGCRGRFEGGNKPRGWLSAEAYFCYKEAKSAEADEEWGDCVDHALASLETENRVGTRGLYARCLEADDQWTMAIEQYQQLAREAPRQRQFNLAQRATMRAAVLQRRMPAIILQAPNDVESLSVKLDGTELPLEILGGEIPIDPGEHKIVASATGDGLPLGFEQTVDVEPNRTLTLLLTLTPGNPDPETRALLKCLAAGKTPEDCLASSSSAAGDLTYRIATEVSGYHDTMDVDVLSPSVSFNMEHVTDGWGVGASFLVDVVTAASTDILATASPRWQEVRYVPAINGHKKFGDYDLALRGNLSREPDYLATSVGASLSAELMQKMVVPSIGYEFSHDVNAKAHTSWDVFSTRINRHALNLGLGLVLTKATFGSLAYTMVFENGDSSKPYRHISMFSPAVAPGVPAGLTIDAVNFFREPERPLEQLPTSRKRFALAASVAHRFPSATLRGSQRVYLDTWGTKAATTDARFMYDIIKELRIWPHVRFHGQTAARFYELAYVAERTADGVKIPAIRTGDRELGPIIALTGGGGARWDFGPRRKFGLTLSGDVVYTRFLNHLFVRQRIGYFGALGFDAEFE